MKEPTGCVLWNDPESVVTVRLRESFELLETLEHESHWWRYLLKCRECGQMYFYEFYEEVDWQHGKDPQFCTWIPVETDLDIETIREAGPLKLRKFRPSLHKDWPKDAAERKVYWVKDEQ